MVMVSDWETSSPMKNLSILAGTQPSGLHHTEATARLVSRAMCHPFVPATKELLRQCKDLKRTFFLMVNHKGRIFETIFRILKRIILFKKWFGVDGRQRKVMCDSFKYMLPHISALVIFRHRIGLLVASPHWLIMSNVEWLMSPRCLQFLCFQLFSPTRIRLQLQA